MYQKWPKRMFPFVNFIPAMKAGSRAYLALTPATAGVRRCHKIFGRCRQVSGNLVEAHGVTSSFGRCRQVLLAVLAGVGRCY